VLLDRCRPPSRNENVLRVEASGRQSDITEGKRARCLSEIAEKL
jgi:hypothetical protein